MGRRHSPHPTPLAFRDGELLLRLPADASSETRQSILSLATALGHPCTDDQESNAISCLDAITYDKATHELHPEPFELSQALISLIVKTDPRARASDLTRLVQMAKTTIDSWVEQARAIADDLTPKMHGETAASSVLRRAQSFKAMGMELKVDCSGMVFYDSLRKACHDWRVPATDLDKSRSLLRDRKSVLQEEMQENFRLMSSVLPTRVRHLISLPLERMSELSEAIDAIALDGAVTGDALQHQAMQMLHEELNSAELDIVNLPTLLDIAGCSVQNQLSEECDRSQDSDETVRSYRTLGDCALALSHSEKGYELCLDDLQIGGKDRQTLYAVSCHTGIPLASAPANNIVKPTDFCESKEAIRRGAQAFLEAWEPLEKRSRAALMNEGDLTGTKFRSAKDYLFKKDIGRLSTMAWKHAEESRTSIQDQIVEYEAQANALSAPNHATKLLQELITAKIGELDVQHQRIWSGIVDRIANLLDLFVRTGTQGQKTWTDRQPPYRTTSIYKIAKSAAAPLSGLLSRCEACGVDPTAASRLSVRDLLNIGTITARMQHNEDQAWERLCTLSSETPGNIQIALDKFKKRKPRPRGKSKRKKAQTSMAAEAVPEFRDVSLSRSHQETCLDSELTPSEWSAAERAASASPESAPSDLSDVQSLGEGDGGTMSAEGDPWYETSV